MFGIGFPELIVICIVALIFIGPKKLPDLMRQGGKLFVQLRRTANDVRSTFDQVVHEAEEELRKSEVEALRQAILADHVKSPKLLDAGTVTASSSDSHDPNSHHHGDVDHHSDHHLHDHPDYHDRHNQPSHHHDHGHTEIVVDPGTHQQSDPHRPDGAQPFQPNLLGSVSPKNPAHQGPEVPSHDSVTHEHTPSEKTDSQSTTTTAPAEAPKKPKDYPVS